MQFEITKLNIILEASSKVEVLLFIVFCSQQIGTQNIEQNRSRCRILPSHDEELVDLFLDEGAAGIPHLLLQFLKLSTIILSWQTNSHRSHSLQNAYCFEMRLLLHILSEANIHLCELNLVLTILFSTVFPFVYHKTKHFIYQTNKLNTTTLLCIQKYIYNCKIYTTSQKLGII